MTPTTPEEPKQWTVEFSCCGWDDGAFVYDSWQEANAVRESYLNGPGVASHGYSSPPSEPGHRRAAIIREALP